MNDLLTIALATALVGAGAAAASTTVSSYDDLGEGFLGTTFSYNGVTYRDANNVSGVFPDGDTFTPGDIGDNFIIERATLLYNDFPGWGSPNNALTFGTAFIPGDNLSLGAFANAWMDLDTLSDFVSMEMAYFENGPWGGIVFQLDAYRDGAIVGSDSFTISGANPGRDNIAFAQLSIDGVAFDSLNLRATFDGQFSAPRLMIDDLTLRAVPAPASALSLLTLAGFASRRRR